MQHKKHKTSENQLTKQKQANKKQQKQQFFAYKNFIRWKKIVYFVFLCCRNFFKNKQKSVLITSLTILLTCTSLNLPMENLFACTYFYLSESLFIHDNLGESFLLRKSFFIYDHWWESFWTLPVCGNLFLFMLICKNLFLFMFICENLFYEVHFWGSSFGTHFLREQF